MSGDDAPKKVQHEVSILGLIAQINTSDAGFLDVAGSAASYPEPTMIDDASSDGADAAHVESAPDVD